MKLLRWRRSNAASLALAMATATLTELLRLLRMAKEETVRCKMGVRASRASAGGVKDALWPGVAWLGRPAAARGFIASTRQPAFEAGRPPKVESIQSSMPETEPDDTITRRSNC